MFGLAKEDPQNEQTPFHPRSPYAVGKVFAYWMTINYRESYGFHSSNGILFNHESPKRGETFVTRKISRAVARIKKGLQDKLYLGNLDAKRDWGYAPEYVEGMWRILQQNSADDFVLATGETHTVREFMEIAFAELGFNLTWVGKGAEEKGIDQKSGKELVAVDPKYYRPTEVDMLIGDASKAKRVLGWEPKVKFEELARMMAIADWEKVQKRGY
jgi:GDPmannose 4,6-dehydratase